MLERKTKIDMIEKSRDGYIGLRIALLIMDGDIELAKRWHRVAISQSDDVELVMINTNEHLKSIGEECVSEQEIAIVAAEHKSISGWPV